MGRIQLEIILNYKDLISNFRSLDDKLFATSLRINKILVIKTQLKSILNYIYLIQKRKIISTHKKN